MSISLKFEPHEGFLHCKASGEFSSDDACLVIRDVLAESAERGTTRVLVDCLQMRGSPTVAERYAVSEFIASEMFELNRFPRVVVLGKEPLIDPKRFGELVARNRGVQTKTVEQMEDAVKWLRQELRVGIERCGTRIERIVTKTNIEHAL